MMYREHMDLVGPHKPVHNPIRAEHDLAHRGRVEFGYRSTGFRKLSELICGGNQSSDDDRGVMGES